MNDRRIAAVRAYTNQPGGGGGDYHDQAAGHWIDTRIATPLSQYPPFRERRASFGINVLGSLVVEVEDDAGHVGIGVSTGGSPGAWIVEHHLARFVEGARVGDHERIWDQMFHGTIFYGRKGLALNAISAVDLALWDLLGQVRDEPVYAMIGGAVRDELTCYATGPRPDVAAELGFVGGKLPLRNNQSAGPGWWRDDTDALADARHAVGDDFLLMLDCWMSLDLPAAIELAGHAAEHGLHWIEEPFVPDDYWSYAALKRALPPGMLLATGEHEYTRLGFRMLLEMDCCDVVQPDVSWCGGLTELLHIDALARSFGRHVIPHGSSVYSYHFVVTRHSSPITEFLMMHPEATEVVPMFHPLLVGEPVPEHGRVTLPDRPGFGVTLNPDVELERPHAR